MGTSERKELVTWKRFKMLAGEGIIEVTRLKSQNVMVGRDLLSSTQTSVKISRKIVT